MPARLSGSAPDSETALARQRPTPDLAQQTDRLGQRKLLAREAGDEAAAANFPARFELTITA